MTENKTGLIALRAVLLSLTYIEMMEFSEWLANVDPADDTTAGDAGFWASVVADWAMNAEIAE